MADALNPFLVGQCGAALARNRKFGGGEATQNPHRIGAASERQAEELNIFEPALSIIHLSEDAPQARTANKYMLVLFPPNYILAD